MAVTSQRVQQKNVALNTVVMSVLSNTAGTSSMFNASAPVPNFFKQYFPKRFSFFKTGQPYTGQFVHGMGHFE